MIVTWSLLPRDLLNVVMFGLSDMNTIITVSGVCREWRGLLTSFTNSVNTSWRSLYMRTWPFIVLPDHINQLDWRSMLLHHRTLFYEIRDVWKLFYQRLKQYTIKGESRTWDLKCIRDESPHSCSPADLVAWQHTNQSILPIDFCFSMLTCGDEEFWKSFEIEDHRRGFTDDYSVCGPIQSLSSCCYNEFDYEMDEARLLGPLRFLIDPKADPKFVVLRDYVCDYVHYVAMQVVDTNESPTSSLMPTKETGNSSRSSKRARTVKPTSNNHICNRYPSSYDSFSCSCLESRCNCRYSRLRGIMMIGHNSVPEWRFVHESWLSWLRVFRKDLQDSSSDFEYGYSEFGLRKLY